ncbi:MAG: thiamine phosphate synthase [Deltaproteobacteria bacterium]|nr:thiamine phosphate synthase [Deltaproteobacteria bacterium]
MAPRLPDFDLYLVTDRQQTAGKDLAWVLGRALEGGVRAIQLREKDLGGRELFILAEKIKRLCESHRAGLFINDRVDVALGVDADGVQLGVGSLPVGVARELLGEKKLIGVSTHSLAEAKAAEAAGADFILFGPVYETPSKAVYGKPQGGGRLKEVVEKVSFPVYAIGGIQAGNIAEVKGSGAAGVALISAVLAAADPLAAAREILALWKG